MGKETILICTYDYYFLDPLMKLLCTFQDVGGSGPIHTVGGAAALVINIICRPSKENRQREARVIVNDITGHSVPVSRMEPDYDIFVLMRKFSNPLKHGVYILG